MSSLFEAIDQQTNHTIKFWRPTDEFWTQDTLKNKLHESELLFLLPNGSFKTRKAILTTTRIYYLKPSTDEPKKMVIVTWKKIEPFCEESDSEERFGFRLFQRGVFQDFYTNTPKELESWLDMLSKVTILSDLEDDYAIIKEVGSGTYAVVSLAQDLQDHKEYAVKSIKKEVIVNSSRNLNALISEISVMRKLNHPNLIKLHRVYENEKFIHLILDYIPGGDLFQRIVQKSVFSEETAAKLMTSLLKTIKYMHSVNIMHRDLKPENILMLSNENDYEFKIADFGLACEITVEQMQRCGSPGYVAPEILKKRAYGTKVDIFSAGIILYVLLSSRAPFYGKTANEVLLRNKECKIYFQDRYWKNVSKEGIDCVLRLTDPNPECRPSAKESLKHPWLNMQHKKDINQDIKIKESPLGVEISGISSELMRRMNDKRVEGGVKEEVKTVGGKKSANPNNARNLLIKLRDADNALN